LSNKNRTVVKDGRLQVKKKRTDRSYLQPEPPAAPATEADPVDELVPSADAALTESAAPAAPEPAAEAPPEDPAAAFTPPPPAPPPVQPAPIAPPATAVAATAPLTGAARALQQQGVRKRREVDLDELARRDSSYAMHELRRIAILTAMVVLTLVVLAIVLR
jgi:hypothetical protein